MVSYFVLERLYLMVCLTIYRQATFKRKKKSRSRHLSWSIFLQRYYGEPGIERGACEADLEWLGGLVFFHS